MNILDTNHKLYFNDIPFCLPFHYKIYNKNLFLDRLIDIKDGINSYFAK